MAGKQSKSAMLVKKKVWVPMIAPALFNNQPIGEMYLTEDANPVGRQVTVSLMTLTGDPQRQNIHISFKISKAENNQLLTTLVNWNWARSGQHLEAGRMSIRQIVEHMVEHEAAHVADIRRLRKG